MHKRNCLKSHVAAQLCSCCIMAVCDMCLFLAVPWVGQLSVILALSGHTYFCVITKIKFQAEVVQRQS